MRNSWIHEGRVLILSLNIVVKYLFININELESPTLAVARLSPLNLKQLKLWQELVWWVFLICLTLVLILGDIVILIEILDIIRFVLKVPKSEDFCIDLVLRHFEYIVDGIALFYWMGALLFLSEDNCFWFILLLHIFVLVEYLSVEVITIEFLIRFREWFKRGVRCLNKDSFCQIVGEG